MYELLFSSQQRKAKNFRRHYCNVMFPHIRQQFANKMEEDHQFIITHCDNQISAIQYGNVTLKVQSDAYQAEIRRCEDTITYLRPRYVDQARDPGKYNINMI